MTPSNLDRANWADQAIRTFRAATGCDHEDSLGDLLTDLIHWANLMNFDFDLALERARGHYDAEIAEEAAERALAVDCIAPESRQPLDAEELLAALHAAVTALNTTPRFKVPALGKDSYAVAALCDRAIAKAKNATE